MVKELQVTKTDIPGLLIIDLPVHGDNRGWFKENWQRQKMTAAGLPDFDPVQNNISFNTSVGTTRGIHAEPWDKYVSVATGRIFGAWVDLRQGESFGAVVTAELGPDTAVFVPRGVGNAFQTLEPNTAYSYLVNDHWSADAVGGYSFLNLADETAAIDWPIELSRAELSEKDRNHPRLGQIAALTPDPILVVGANGQLGQELVKQLTQRGVPFVAVGRDELDLAHPQQWQHTLRWRSYRAVINAAAYTAVDQGQTVKGRAQAWAVNATGVAALVRACEGANLPLVHISTDYVFDGELPVGSEYPVGHPVAPLSVYGASKAAGEAAAAAWSKHYLVRTSWVVGVGKNFVATMASLAERGVNPAVVADQWGRPTFTKDLAAAVLHLLDEGAEYGTYHVSNTGAVITWAQFARDVYRATGHDPARVSETTTEQYFADATVYAPRPVNSALDLSKLIATGFTPRDHTEALAEYIKTL